MAPIRHRQETLSTRTKGSFAVEPSIHLLRAMRMLLHRLSWYAALFLTTTAAISPTFAKAEDLHALAAMDLDSLLEVEIEGVSKFSQPLRSSPSSATVITAADIFALGYRTLSDVLQSVRGLNVNGDRSYAYLGVRGIAAPGDYNSRVLLLIDGNRINDGVYDQAFLGSEFPLDLDLVERIEFIPGPGSAVHGANAVFAVVNVVTKQGLAGRRASGSLTIGSGGARTASVMLQAGEAGAPQLFIAASRSLAAGRNLYYPQYDSPATSDGISSRTDDERQSRLFLRAEDGRGLTATLIHADRIKGASASPATVFGDPATSTHDVQTHASLSWSGRIAPQVDLTARAYASAYRFTGDYLLDLPSPILNRDTAESVSQGLEVRAAATAWRGHKAVVGFEAQRSPKRDQANFDRPDGTLHLNDRRSGHRFSLFAEDQIELTPTWTLSIGGRSDDTESGKPVLSPRFGAVWQPSATWVVKYLHGGSYRQPNASERYYAFPGEGGYKTDPDLGKETVRGQELAIEYQPGATLKWTVAAYRSRIEGLIVQRLDPDDGLLMFANGSKLKTRGLEIEVEASLPYTSRLRANYSVQSGIGTASDQSARHLANATFLLPLSGNWMAGVAATAVSRRAAAPGFAMADVTLSNDAPWRNWRVALSVYNAFDRRAADPSVDAALPGIVPRDARGARLKLGLRF
jgi:outer membrane receptor protein involved in Fe transport